MRITNIAIYPVSIPFRQPFGHALHWRDKADTIILCISCDSGQKGWGEILPRSYLGGGTIDKVLSRDLPELFGSWRGRTFESGDQVVAALREERHTGSYSLAACAGWELAVLDLAGKAFGFAAGDILGSVVGPEVEAGVVIGFDIPTEKLEKHCLLLRLTGRRHIKVKVGRCDDLRRLQIVSATLGPAVPIRVDANGAWSVDEAISQLRQMQRWNVRSVEQPVAAHNLDGMRNVREKTGMTVVADESLCSFLDACSIIQARAADVFNIRIAKCGGFLASLDLVILARDSGLCCQLGTLVGETGILSRASEIFAERVAGFCFLEGKGQNRRLLVEDIVEDPGAHGIYGLGITVAENSLARWAASTSTTLAGVQGVAT
ncbi:MAG TPA: enolase C-terminal domain-like protein [Verrucomicrobiae bacterium]|nr:enolase C-terminal domain-like protein [Verrucomicrobiae bacterium]